MSFFFSLTKKKSVSQKLMDLQTFVSYMPILTMNEGAGQASARTVGLMDLHELKAHQQQQVPES